MTWQTLTMYGCNFSVVNWLPMYYNYCPSFLRSIKWTQILLWEVIIHDHSIIKFNFLHSHKNRPYSFKGVLTIWNKWYSFLSLYFYLRFQIPVFLFYVLLFVYIFYPSFKNQFKLHFSHKAFSKNKDSNLNMYILLTPFILKFYIPQLMYYILHHS